MGRLIDADALIEKLKRTSAFNFIRNAADKNVFEIINDQPTAYDVDRTATLIYDLLNEYDIGLWRDIEYIDLAEMWVDAIDNKIYDEDKLKEKIKEFIVRRGGTDER